MVDVDHLSRPARLSSWSSTALRDDDSGKYIPTRSAEEPSFQYLWRLCRLRILRWVLRLRSLWPVFELEMVLLYRSYFIGGHGDLVNFLCPARLL